jgi:rare lipoprotein A
MRVVVACALAVAMFPDIVLGAQGEFIALTTDTQKSDSNSGAVVLTPGSVELTAARDNTSSSPGEITVQNARLETCSIESTAARSLMALPRTDSESLPSFVIAPRTPHDMLDLMREFFAPASTNGVDLISFARKKMLPEFATAYRSLLKRVAMMGLPRIEDAAALARTTISGKVSTYNPYRDGREEGGPETASGEPYDPNAWTAAIKTNLRGRFGGVRYGRLYQPAFALVQSGARQLIVKINDVGPLRPGRVLDLNERSMRHFDPFLTRGVLEDARITLLPGEDWTPGPVGTAYAIDFISAERRPQVARFGPDDSISLQTDSEPARLKAPPGRVSGPNFGGDVRAEVRPSEGG